MDRKKIDPNKYFYLIFFMSLVINSVTDNWLKIDIYGDQKFPYNTIMIIISVIKTFIIYFILYEIVMKIKKNNN